MPSKFCACYSTGKLEIEEKSKESKITQKTITQSKQEQAETNLGLTPKMPSKNIVACYSTDKACKLR
tara:strand:- start:552 stop:752 length:201 start_codon:yes stop_codon:yes gene_type:complete